ncbi:flagellar basal body L-ring protein FlgH, partial [Gammaproteobacteria bacterium]|nr:flagellar basal body L-ring protein FlgH [Gammaproteobacteria bacterium]
MIKMYRALQLFLLILLALLTGCVGSPRSTHPDFAPSYVPVVTTIEKNIDGAIFNSGTEVALFEDIKAHRVGDILTVMLVEQTTGQKSSDNSLNQSTAMNVGTPTFGGSARANMEINLDSANSFNGESGSSQSNSLSGSIAVIVSEVLPGGNLRVQGEKWIQINQGSEYIRLRGIVRQRDIDANNTLFSTQVADARISYGGT